MPKSIHQEVTIKASAKKVFDALTDAKQFSAFSGGAPAAGFPEEAGPHLESGWAKMYWEPLKAYLE